MMNRTLPEEGSRPRSLRELRIWLVGSESLSGPLSRACTVDALAPADWQGRIPEDRRPSFFLVEAAEGVEEAWGDELDRVLEHCERDDVLRVLWIAESPVAPNWLERCTRFDRVFTVDGSQLAELEAAGARAPSTLWPAAPSARGTQAGPREIAPSETRKVVLWLGGWRPGWPLAWRNELASILRGAGGRGLRIVQDAALDGLPADLEEYVCGANSEASRKAALREADVVIGADPSYGSPTLAPRVVFEAAACGSAVITPHRFATIHDFGVGAVRGALQTNLVPVVQDADSAAEQIDRLTGDALLRSEVVSHLQRIVAHNHTYHHRLATLASSVGYRLAPDAFDTTPG